jgi:hypothetical protein
MKRQNVAGAESRAGAVRCSSVGEGAPAMANQSVHEQSTLILKPARRAAGGLLRRLARAIHAVDRCAAEEPGALQAAVDEVRALTALGDDHGPLDDGVREERRRLATRLFDAYARLDERIKDQLEAAFRAAQ